MVLLTKIYTRTGDAGQTGIGDGTRVSKLDQRIVAGGIVDELNSFVGLSVCESEVPAMQEVLTSIQQRLFDLGADLTTPWDPQNTGGNCPRISQKHVANLEALIDEFNADLGNLKSFVLPAGTKSAATLHVARSVCRRAELGVLKLRQVENLNPQIAIYLNRLSDLLFVLARTANNNGQSDVLWVPERPSSKTEG
ncbi:UNVERIFIED_CONTAM: hypothetical protein GTU68_050308 [Idotea baltica]|nr:hypothetical protein [Idotea baltica]